jgi:hypothetical protein
MGYYVTYSLKLRIRAKNISKALEIFNNLHTDEMLVKYARGGMYPREGKEVSEMYWYSWVNNPKEPYTSLEEAFKNWRIVENNVKYCTEKKTGDFLVSGKYNDKIGQQDFLIKMLAPVLSNTYIDVTGEDFVHYIWIVDRHKYRAERFDGVDEKYNSSDDESGGDTE